MVTILVGTDRKQSESRKIANSLQLIYNQLHQPAQILDLSEVNPSWLNHSQYNYQNLPEELGQLYQRYFVEASHLHFVVPEYNGSYPGCLKYLIDVLSAYPNYKTTFASLKATITGVASGRAGNLRGIDHLTAVLMYLQVQVSTYNLPISSIYKQYNQEKQLEAEIIDNLTQQIGKFLQI